jgi:hypothetical protein
MGNVMVIAAIMLAVGFIGGILAAVVVIVSVASRREDKNRPGGFTG